MNKKKNGGCGCVSVLIFLLIVGGIITYWPIALIVLVIILILVLINKSKIKSSPLANIDFDNMDGHQFEYFCAKVLRMNGFQNVKVTQGSGDHGIDVLANKDGMRYAIQCKCYSKNVGNKAVQEAYSGKAIYQADIAVVLTNRYYTEQAKNDARKLGVQLWDRAQLNRFISNANRESNDSEGEKMKSDIAKERIYKINDVTVQFEIDKSGNIEVSILCDSDIIGFSCIFFYLYMKLAELKKELIWNMDYKINAKYGEKVATCQNEYVFGENLDGSISRTTPDWLEDGRKTMLESGTGSYSYILGEIEECFNDFVRIVRNS